MDHTCKYKYKTIKFEKKSRRKMLQTRVRQTIQVMTTNELFRKRKIEINCISSK